MDQLHPKPEIVDLILNATWKNNSGLPVWIDHLRTRVDLYPVPDDLPVGAIRPKEDLGNPLDTIRPFEDMDQYMLEPNASETT